MEKKLFGRSLEAAVNPHSCALACLVSLCRDHDLHYSQAELIAQFTSEFPCWIEAPGSMILERMINFSASLLGTRAHIVTMSKELILRNWRSSDCIGAFIFTGRQRDALGKLVPGNHAWRLLDCSEEKLALMNPAEGEAQVITVGWDFLPGLCGYALLLHGKLHDRSQIQEHYK